MVDKVVALGTLLLISPGTRVTGVLSQTGGRSFQLHQKKKKNRSIFNPPLQHCRAVKTHLHLLIGLWVMGHRHAGSSAPWQFHLLLQDSI